MRRQKTQTGHDSPTTEFLTPFFFLPFSAFYPENAEIDIHTPYIVVCMETFQQKTSSSVIRHFGLLLLVDSRTSTSGSTCMSGTLVATLS